MSKKLRYVVGIDEAGRGPLAGPVFVGAVLVDMKDKHKLKLLKGIKDSKKISQKKREEWSQVLRNNFEYHTSSISNSMIDKIGIQRAVLLGVKRVLRKMKRRPDIVLLDGLLRAPESYKQETIIKGDEKIPAISAASIVAKVGRDKKMVLIHADFPEYGFDRHKGYGTKLHYENIKKNGLSSCHRKTFCVNCINYVNQNETHKGAHPK
ncbi:MAG: ribonuclease HII [Parcubacteria group bacterium CG10_big_fil_rev_8_21_14_0_10_38_31]|nr:MAG: ribonuclease HII [Parcubacteria group bacterium CG10_big_fil_rev_8_21_14_0_10_38_31]